MLHDIRHIGNLFEGWFSVTEKIQSKLAYINFCLMTELEIYNDDHEIEVYKNRSYFHLQIIWLQGHNFDTNVRNCQNSNKEKPSKDRTFDQKEKKNYIFDAEA